MKKAFGLKTHYFLLVCLLTANPLRPGISANPFFETSYSSEGCTDPIATNYDPFAQSDDGSCVFQSDDCGLIISEFGQFDGYDRFIELYNAGIEEINLSSYFLAGCNGPCDSPSSAGMGIYETTKSLTASSFLSPGETYVLVHPQAYSYLSLADGIWGGMPDGAGTIALVKSIDGALTVVDGIGEAASSGSGAWSIAGSAGASSNQCISRKASVSTGNFGDWLASSGTNPIDSEWELNGSLNCSIGSHSSIAWCAENVVGCTDSLACNYNEFATIQFGTCNYPTDYTDCSGACIHGETSDGGCIILGCTNPAACNYLDIANQDDGQCEFCSCDGEFVNPEPMLVVEEHAVNGVLGMTTYRIYVETAAPDDFVSSVFGNNTKPLTLWTENGFYNSEFASGFTADGVNALFFQFFPEVAFDSWVTIGIDSSPTPPFTSVSAVESGAQPWTGAFKHDSPLAGSDIVISDEVGGAWYVINGTPNGLPQGENNRVLIAQITTDGSLGGTLNVQIFEGGDTASQQQKTFEFVGTGSFSPSGAATIDNNCGCLESSACNFDPEALIDDGNCFFDCTNCTDPNASNFNPSATEDDGTCIYAGCTDPSALNFDASVTVDDGSCEYAGCTDPSASNFNPSATEDDGSCMMDQDNDGIADDLDACSDISACNYDYSSTSSNDPCDYSCVCNDESACNYGETVHFTGVELLVELWEFEGDAEESVWTIASTNQDTLFGGASDLALIPIEEGGCWTIASQPTIPEGFIGQLALTFIGSSETNANLPLPDTLVISADNPVEYSFCYEDLAQPCSYAETLYFDEDGDGFGSADSTTIACSGELGPEWVRFGWDDCPNNEEIVHVGPCGCTPEADIDADGILDCYDNCFDTNACNWSPFFAEDTDGCDYSSCQCLDESACNFGEYFGNGPVWLLIDVTDLNWEYFGTLWNVTSSAGEYIEGGFGNLSLAPTSVDDCWELQFLTWPVGFSGTVFVDFFFENGGGPFFHQELDLTAFETHTFCVADLLPECNFPDLGYDCNGECLADSDNDGVCDALEIPGCTNASACNYASLATDDDGTCYFAAEGYLCDGSCVDSDFDGICDVNEVIGCTFSGACTFDSLATDLADYCIFPAAFQDCQGNCYWESAATNSCGSLAGQLCSSNLIAVQPAVPCEGSHGVYSIEDGQLQSYLWGEATLPTGAYSALFTEPNTGTLIGVNAAGYAHTIDSMNCLGLTLPGINNVKTVDIESGHGLYLRHNGTVISFATEDANSELQQTPIIFNYNILDVATGTTSNLAVDGSPNVIYWGVPNFDLQYNYLETPHAGGFVQIDAFNNTAAAVTNLGELVVWGEDSGALVSDAPQWVSDAVKVILGDGFGLVLHETGIITAWGEKVSSGELSMPSGLSNVVDIAGAKDAAVALLADGSLVNWRLTPEDFQPQNAYTPIASASLDLDFCIHGCTDEAFLNFDPYATIDDGSCQDEGCTDSSAYNFDPWALYDDGSCIVIGCTDPTACNYNPNAQYTLQIDTVAVHDGFVGAVDLAGYTTYRIYITSPNAFDRLSAVAGNDTWPLNIHVHDGEVFQSAQAGNVTSNINQVFIPFIPSLEFDSWVTIGATPATYNPSEPIQVVESPDQPWIFNFESEGQGITMTDEIGGAWFVAGAQTTGLVGADGRALIAQITTNGSIEVESLFYQLLPFEMPGEDVQVYWQNDLHECTYPPSVLTNCEGQCLNDSDGDGVCDESEVDGCQNPLACNFNPLATDDDGSCNIPTEEIRLEVDQLIVHDTAPLVGFSTYRLYAQLRDSSERVSAVFGDDQHPAIISSNDASLFYQHPFGGPLPQDISSVELSIDPHLQFDSYVALGKDHEELPTAVSILSSPTYAWDNYFEMGLPISISSSIGGGWYSIDSSDGKPNPETNRVFLGQFTTTGGIEGQLSIQIETCGAASDSTIFDLIFSSNSDGLGCLDESACNFSTTATIDDGSCCFANCIQTTTHPVVITSLDGQTISPIQTDEENASLYCLTETCYLLDFDGSLGEISWNEEMVDPYSWSLGILNQDGNCVGCLDPAACNYSSSALFDDNNCLLLPGDFDGNGESGVADMLVLLSQFEDCAPQDNCSSDMNSDGLVNVADLLTFLSGYGASCDDWY